MQLTNGQQNTMGIFKDFLLDKNKKYMIIQGAAGVGKSFLLKPMVKAVKNKSIELTATTNPAVAVLEDLTEMSAKTIYSLLGLRVTNNFQTGRTNIVLNKSAQTQNNKVIFIDEGSMIDDTLFEYIESQTGNCKVVIVGDWFQLAPVGQVTVTMQHIEGTQAIMNEIMRNSGIIMETGQQFRETVETGIFNPIPKGHDAILHLNGADFQAMVEAEFMRDDYSPKKAKMIAYTNAMVLDYSAHIRAAKGCPPELQIGEKVITNKPIPTTGQMISIDTEVEITNISPEYAALYDIAGKDIEINNHVEAFMPNDQNQVKRLVKQLGKQKNWSDYFYIKDNWMDLRLPYASTVHKAQGSSYDKVFIDLDNIGLCHISSDVARMMYVSISRARYQVILYGELPPYYSGK